jgi:hypothetical protein
MPFSALMGIFQKQGGKEGMFVFREIFKSEFIKNG